MEAFCPPPLSHPRTHNKFLTFSNPPPPSPRKFCVRCSFVPAINPEEQPPFLPIPTPTPPGSNLSPSKASSSARGQSWRVHAKQNSSNGKWWWWRNHNESALNKDEPLPLPMVYPGSTPNREEVENMKNCDPDKKDCKDVLYQWTGKCTRCQGTGEVSYYPKKGREVICKCIPCMGLGYVNKMTLRTDIQADEDADGAL